MNGIEIHDALYEDLKNKFGIGYIFNRSADILPSVEIHPDKMREAILHLKESYRADYLESMDAADLLNFKGGMADRSEVPWSNLYRLNRNDENAGPSEKSENQSGLKNAESGIVSEDRAASAPEPPAENSEKNDETSFQRMFFLQYQLFSFEKNCHYILKTILPFDRLYSESIEDLYGNANWHEREIWDLLGIEFRGSSDLRRILLPENWEGHPLRRDYEQKESYSGMPTFRVSELQKFTDQSAEKIEKWKAEA